MSEIPVKFDSDFEDSGRVFVGGFGHESISEKLERFKAKIEARAKRRGTTYTEELRRYGEMLGEELEELLEKKRTYEGLQKFPDTIE